MGVCFCDSSYNTDAQCAQAFFSFSLFFFPREPKSFHQFFCFTVTMIILAPSSSCCTFYRFIKPFIGFTHKTAHSKEKDCAESSPADQCVGGGKIKMSPLSRADRVFSFLFFVCCFYCPLGAHTNRCKIFLRSYFCACETPFRVRFKTHACFWTVYVQKIKTKRVCFNFGPRGGLKGWSDIFRELFSDISETQLINQGFFFFMFAYSKNKWTAKGCNIFLN